MFGASIKMDYNVLMKTMHENLNHLILAMILGITSLGVSHIGNMGKNLQDMAISINELNLKMGQIIETTKDHEARIREIEKSKSRSAK